MPQIKITDYSEIYGDLVCFNSNKYKSTHRWFQFVEGYSSEFVRRIIAEQKSKPILCFDPFGGVGTTALVCQELGIKCISFESNPFFHEVARTKLRADFLSNEYEKFLTDFEIYLKNCKTTHKYPEVETKTLFESKDIKRWIFNRQVTYGIIDINSRISELVASENRYSKLFKISLAAILINISNVFRNGKCLSYKTNWENNKIKRRDVHKIFLKHCKEVILADLKTKESSKLKVHNYLYCYNGDSRKEIKDLINKSIDLVITSPPYLNSRDYTDIYRLELWILKFIMKFEEEKKIRKSAFTSHVQVQLKSTTHPQIKELRNYLSHIKQYNNKLWNKNIPNMIKGYFYDFENLLKDLLPKLKTKAKIYINISNSAYFGKICEVDVILAKIAKKQGYKIIEIRLARYIKSSSQQKLNEKIRESVIVLEPLK